MGEDRVRQQGCESDNTDVRVRQQTRPSQTTDARVRQQKFHSCKVKQNSNH